MAILGCRNIMSLCKILSSKRTSNSWFQPNLQLILTYFPQLTCSTNSQVRKEGSSRSYISRGFYHHEYMSRQFPISMKREFQGCFPIPFLKGESKLRLHSLPSLHFTQLTFDKMA